MDRAIRFYTGALGLSLLLNIGFYARVGADRGFWIGLGRSEIPVDERRKLPQTNIAFYAEDVNAAHEELLKRGVEFYQPPFSPGSGVRVAEFYDSEGNRLSLSSDR